MISSKLIPFPRTHPQEVFLSFSLFPPFLPRSRNLSSASSGESDKLCIGMTRDRRNNFYIAIFGLECRSTNPPFSQSREQRQWNESDGPGLNVNGQTTHSWSFSRENNRWADYLSEKPRAGSAIRISYFRISASRGWWKGNGGSFSGAHLSDAILCRWTRVMS